MATSVAWSSTTFRCCHQRRSSGMRHRQLLKLRRRRLSVQRGRIDGCDPDRFGIIGTRNREDGYRAHPSPPTPAITDITQVTCPRPTVATPSADLLRTTASGPVLLAGSVGVSLEDRQFGRSSRLRPPALR